MSVCNKEAFFLDTILSTNLILFSNSSTRDGILEELTSAIAKEGLLKDNRDVFFQAIVDRENLMSTGIGLGVAIPHGKLSNYDRFFMAVGIQPEGILWDAIDGELVRLVFLIGGPDNAQKEYLQLLSKLTLSLRDDERRRRLLQVSTAEEVLDIFKGM